MLEHSHRDFGLFGAAGGGRKCSSAYSNSAWRWMALWPKASSKICWRISAGSCWKNGLLAVAEGQGGVRHGSAGSGFSKSRADVDATSFFRKGQFNREPNMSLKQD